MNETKNSQLTLPLWFLFGGRHLILGKTMSLMRAVNSQGSITRAAAAVPMSYKAAWDCIDKLNNISPEPAVVTATGGRNGGGASLSEYGKTLLSLYTSLEHTYNNLTHDSVTTRNDMQDFIPFMNGICMKTSARNQLYGTVTQVNTGTVNSRISIRIGKGVSIVATITNESAATLALSPGTRVFALINAPSVILFSGATPVTTSAENILGGTVAEIRRGKVNAEIIINLTGGKTITAVITCDSLCSLEPDEGAPLFAAFSASQVIIALPV